MRAKAESLRAERKRALAELQKREADRRAREAEQARRDRLEALRRRGEAAWDMIEAEIQQRNTANYERALTLLRDLQQIASEDGFMDIYKKRLEAIRRNHARKAKFINQIKDL